MSQFVEVKVSSPMRGASGGRMTLLLDDVVCYGRVSANLPEAIWMSNGLSLEVVDGTCEMLRRAFCDALVSAEVACCVPAEEPEPSHSVTAVEVRDGRVKMVNSWGLVPPAEG